MAESYPVAQLLSEVQQKRSDAGLNPGPYNNLFVLAETETIAAALRKLHAHKILSAPVEFQGRNRGIIDLADVCAAIANAPALNIDTKTLMSMPLKDFFGKVMGMPVRDAVTISVKLPVLEAITALSGNHRVLVTDPDNDDKPVGLLSQMDVLRFVVRHWDQVPRAVREERAEKLMTKNPHTVAQKDRVAEALKVFGKENVSGVGVVDEQGKLVANFSIADLRSAVPEALPELLKESVVGFLHKTKGHAAHGDLLTKDLILADPDTALEDAAKQMLAHHVHRLYVLDGKGKPAGVLSTTDMCAFLAKALGKKASPK